MPTRREAYLVLLAVALGVGAILVQPRPVAAAGAPPAEAVAADRAHGSSDADGDVLDVALHALFNISQVIGAHVGQYPDGRAALSMATTSCNVGTVAAPWRAPMQEEHPVIAMQLYRELNGRFEQIGISWVKHGFFALSDPDCGTCQSTNGTALGVGCSDTYGTGNNSNRTYLGPREEIDPYTGTWSCTGSYFAGGQPDCIDRRPTLGPFGPLDHRLEVADADLGLEGATYVYEAYYVVAGDVNRLDNIGSRRCTASWSGVSWVFSTPATDNALLHGPALLRWGEVHTWASVGTTDGDVLLAVDTTDLGGGMWRYEYALFNLDSDRQVRALTIPIGEALVEETTFHDWDADAANDWPVSIANGAITWETDTFDSDPDANALSYGLLFNFGFTANAAPVDGQAALGIFKPSIPARGGPDVIAAATLSPDKAVPVLPGIDGGGAAPVVGRLGAPAPNPTGGASAVPFALARPARVEVTLFDAAGRYVRTLLPARRLSVGAHEVSWDGRDAAGERAPAGVYFVRLNADGRAIGARSVVLAR